MGHSGVLKMLKAAKDEDCEEGFTIADDTMRDAAALKRWVDELNAAATHAKGIQSYARCGNADGIVEVIADMTLARPQLVETGTSTKLLASFLRKRLAITCQHAQVELRTM